jgi:hypothetical protein
MLYASKLSANGEVKAGKLTRETTQITPVAQEG